MRPQRITLEDHRHPAPLRRHRAARLRDGAAADPDRALVGIEETGHQPQRRRLAATRRAQKTDERTVRDCQTQRIERDGAAEIFRQRFEFDRRHNRYRLPFDRRKGTSIRPPPGVSRRSRRSIAESSSPDRDRRQNRRRMAVEEPCSPTGPEVTRKTGEAANAWSKIGSDGITRPVNLGSGSAQSECNSQPRIPSSRPTGPAYGRPEDKLRAGTHTFGQSCGWPELASRPSPG